MKKNKQEIMYLNKHNVLVKAKYSLNVSELKVYLYILHSMQKEIENNNTQNVKIYDDYVSYTICRQKLVNATSSKQFAEVNKLKKIFEGLRSKPVYYEIEKPNGKKDWSVFGFILKYSYESDTDSYKIIIDKLLYDMILTYKTFGYTSLNLALMFSLDCIYSYRLYELLKLWSNTKGVITYTIDEMRQYFMIDKKKSYDTYANFKNKVILPAVKELNEIGCFDIDIKENKHGKKVVSIDFILNSFNESLQQDIVSIVETIGNEPVVPDSSLFTIGTLRSFKIDFTNYDFNDEYIKNAFNETVCITLEKEQTNKIYAKSYNFFKATLENKIDKHILRQIEDIESGSYWENANILPI